MELYQVGLLSRCKDEFFVKEFCDYYLSEGVDHIYIIDDDSNDKSIYSHINENRITIIYTKNIIETKEENSIYQEIKDKYKWMIYVDIDEFIIPKRRTEKTIKEELETTFKDYDCIKIPWVLFSSGGRKLNPKSIILENNTRWNHNNEHPHKIRKFRCRKKQIEVKCIFKTRKFSNIKDHHPFNDYKKQLKIVNSIDLGQEKLNAFYENLNEEKINNSYLVCYHYRIISRENNLNKLKHSSLYKNNYTLDDLNLSDHSEVIDNELKKRVLMRKKNTIFIHIGKCGGSYIKKTYENVQFTHSKKASSKKDSKYLYFFSLRNPINRFVSAFNHSKNIANYPYGDKSYEELLNDESSPFYQLKNKCLNAKKKKNPFGEWGELGLKYLNLLSEFNSANELAESLNSSNIILRIKANKLVNSKIEHMARGIGWHLDNGKFVEENHSRIIYCEDLRSIDYEIISRITGIEQKKSAYKRENKSNLSTYLSKRSIKNIQNLYKWTDYRALKKLLEFNLIKKELLSSYYDYNQ